MKIKPVHEAIFAGVLMVVFLIVIGIVVADNYAVSPSPGEADEEYSSPVMRIRGATKRINSKLDKYVPLENLDDLYQEKEMIVIDKPVDNKEEPVSVEAPQTEKTNVELNVTGIAWSHRNSIAFVNGEGVTVGETVSGWKVSEITANSVMFRDGEGNHKQVLLGGAQGVKDGGGLSTGSLNTGKPVLQGRAL